MALSSAIRTENIWQFEDAVAHGVALAKVKLKWKYKFWQLGNLFHSA